MRLPFLCVTAISLMLATTPAAVATVWTAAEGTLESCVEAAPAGCPSAVTRLRYLSPSPSGCNVPDGSQDCPWIDRDAALAALEPGDTLILLPGRYDLARGWEIDGLHGTACQPITLAAEPGAVFTAEIAATWRETQTGPGGEPIPDGVRLFEAELDLSADVNFGLFAETSAGGLALARYKRASDLLSTRDRYVPTDPADTATCRQDGTWVTAKHRPYDGQSGLYTGPGFFVAEGETRRRVLVRLQATSTSQLQGFDLETPVERLSEMLRLYRLDSILSVRRSSHLVLRDWHLSYARQLAFLGGAHHIDVLGLRAIGLPGTSSLVLVHGSYTDLRIGGCAGGVSCQEGAPDLCPPGIVCECSQWRDTCFAYEGPPHHLRFRDAELSAGFPPWLFWTDLKWRAGFADEGRCGGWSFLAENDAAACDCADLPEAPTGGASRLDFVHHNPGNPEMHGALFGVIKRAGDLPGPPYCLSVESSHMEDGWFGVYPVTGERLRFADNTFRRIHDDAVLLSNQLDQVEVAHNEIHDVLSSFSTTGVLDHLDTGETFIHHNIVDTTGDGPPARERIACVRPGAGDQRPEWNHHDLDGDGVKDGFCAGLVQGGHGVWGVRWHVYANTLLVDNALPAGALGGVKQNADHPLPAHFVGNILLQNEPARPLYGGIFYGRFGEPGVCADPVLGAQIIDGNQYWRPGDDASAFCADASCCASLPAPAAENPLMVRLSSTRRTVAYSSLAHFQCGVASDGTQLDLAALSACAYPLECDGCEGEAPGVNEARSLFQNPQVTGPAGYRPQAGVARRVHLPREWPESDWPWIGARAPLVGEDCVSFRPDRLEIIVRGEGFQLVDGRHALRFFDRRDEAERSLAILRAYGADQHCFVGRPAPSFSYLLAGHRAPSGALPGEDCIPLDPDRLEISERSGRWFLTQGRRSVFSFDDEAEGRRALELIRLHRFTNSCFVGRPQPSLTYLRR